MNEGLADIAQRRTRRYTILSCALLMAILACGTFLRLKGLGTRSLWLDEFSTWHVSRMPLGDSLRWGPELTKPPLYQLCLRAITGEPHPSEFLLRLPAAICGVLTIAAGFWLAKGAGGLRLALALAGLLAFSALQIEYSQEARSYTMMALGCTLSVAFWYRLVVAPGWRYALGFVFVTALAFHAHYLTVLTVVAEVAWWAMVWRRGPRSTRSLQPPAALALTAILCAPMVLHYLSNQSSVFQGLAWIAEPTWRTSLSVLQELTVGPWWVYGLLAPAIALWLANGQGWLPARGWLLQSEPLASARADSPLSKTMSTPQAPYKQAEPAPSEPPPANGESVDSERINGHQDLLSLLLCWLAAAWFGLLVISWIAHPAMVVRYAIPASVPALLFPLLVAHRLDRRLPPIVATLFVILSAPKWIDQSSEYEPGVRELVAYLQENVDPNQAGVVLTIDNRTYPGWEEMERLALRYYPLGGIDVKELHLDTDGVTPKSKLLEEDPRALYMIVLWADPFAILKAAGRTAKDIVIEGTSYSRLLFTPYRLVLVAPKRAS